MNSSFNSDALAGEIALITGASRGIGAAIAASFAAAGAKVVGTATSEAGASGISATLGDNGRGVVLNIADNDSDRHCFLHQFRSPPHDGQRIRETDRAGTDQRRVFAEAVPCHLRRHAATRCLPNAPCGN